MNERPRVTWSQIVGVAAVLAIVAAVAYPSLVRAREDRPSLQDGAERLAKLHRAIVIYGETHEVWDELPGTGRVSLKAVREITPLATTTPPAELRKLLFSPALPKWAERGLASSHVWRLSGVLASPTGGPASHSVGEPRSTWPNARAEFEDVGSRFPYIVDYVYDEAFFYPQERDQSLGAVALDLQLDGAVEVRRRLLPRITLEESYVSSASPCASGDVATEAQRWGKD